MPIVQLTIFYGSFLVFPILILLIRKYKNTEKKFLTISLIILSLLFIQVRFVEPYLLNVKEYDLNLIDSEDIKIAVFADTHIGVYSSRNFLERIVNKTNEQNPDLILIPGDFVYKMDKVEIAESFESLKNLNAPTFAVLGNHDNGVPGDNVGVELKKVLEDLNIQVIDNHEKEITIKNKKIKITGLEDYWNGVSNNNIKNEDDRFNILLTHNPDILYNIPENSSELAVCGHTHGGQVRLPFLYKKAIPSEYGFDRGIYNIRSTKLFVTPGTGTVLLPFRFLLLPEISILNL